MSGKNSDSCIAVAGHLWYKAESIEPSHQGKVEVCHAANDSMLMFAAITYEILIPFDAFSPHSLPFLMTISDADFSFHFSTATQNLQACLPAWLEDLLLHW